MDEQSIETIKGYKKELEGLTEKLSLLSSEYQYIESELKTNAEKFQAQQANLSQITHELQTTKFNATELKDAAAKIKKESRLKSRKIRKQLKLLLEKEELIVKIDSINSSLQYQYDQSLRELQEIKSSSGWRITLRLRHLSEKLFPTGSIRRKVYLKTVTLLKRLIRIPFSTARKVVRIIPALLRKSKEKVPILHKKKTNKLVYIGHYYHNTSKSTGFLIEYLRKFFDVQVLSDERELGKPFPDLSFIDESYAGVIFFQNLPNPEIYNSVQNSNKVLFPMYDSLVQVNSNYWDSYRDLKIINFSSKADSIFKGLGFKSMYIQYFPKPLPFFTGHERQVFFWQRTSAITIETVVKLFKNEKVQIHLHRAVDPSQKYIPPKEQDIDKFAITFSDWFEYREEMQEIVQSRAIYIAPREFEGIGLSFLEAMAMGKVVIAVNNPTMNEYIVNGKTGYLYDLNNPVLPKLTNIAEMQKATYEYMSKGYELWEKEKINIIKMIKNG